MDDKKTAPWDWGAEDEKIERQNRFIIGLVVNIFVSMVTALLVLKAMGVI